MRRSLHLTNKFKGRVDVIKATLEQYVINIIEACLVKVVFVLFFLGHLGSYTQILSYTKKT